MQRLLLLPILLAILNLRTADGLCDLKNATHAICTDLDDAKFIGANNLVTLSAPFLKDTLKPDYFANLTDLRHLDLSGGSIEHIEPGTFTKLSNLHSLSLAENAIEYLELGSLDGLNHLHTLNLRKNKLEQLPPALARLKILKHVEVHGNPLQCNCATLRVRDLLLKRGLKFSGKKILCSGPKNLKGSSMFKLDSATICNFEQQDREMQNDDAFSESMEDIGSGDAVTDEFLSTSEASTIAESSPIPSSASTSVTPEALDSSANAEPTIATESTDSTSRIAEKEEEIFFDAEEKKSPRKKVFKDALFYPVEGSGEDEGSGEGSGIGLGLGEWTNIGKVPPDEKEEESSSSSGFFESFFSGLWGPTESSTATEEPNLAEEEFINVSSPKEVEESIVPKRIPESDEAPPSSSESSVKIQTTVATLISNGVEIGQQGLNDNDKLGKVQAKETEKSNDALEEVLPSAKQSKKGMGSYVVLAALLAVLATLIGFAAYKGDFCKKKRKRGDPENGTELKDMQKALLETGNNSHAQPKIASNGNVESVPLFIDSVDHSETKVTAEIPEASNGNTEKVEDGTKQARGRTMQREEEENARGDEEDGNFAKDDSLSACRTGFDPAVNNSSIARLAEANGPPLSPGAQRVKITLQENPDSVPRTPILITRTMAGDNLVKLP